ncbi:MAG: peptidoglycan D,D-transpeptidase FtsI family protein [Enterococcus sp.]
MNKPKKTSNGNKRKNFFQGSSKNKTAKTSKKSHIPFRLNLLFFVIFMLFVSLIVRLGYLQIVAKEEIADELNASSVLTVTEGAPRGMIYDASGNALVTNEANQAITFTRGTTMTANDLLILAQKLNQLIDMPVDENLTERDKKDYWLADEDHLETATKRLSAKEEELDSGEQYSKIVEKVTADEINFDEEELKVATIFKRLNGAQAMNTVYVKNEDVTEEELAVVAENSSELPGISTGTDWTRNYVATGSLKSIMGTISTEQAGLPADEAEEYLEKGYASNDRVGTSYLEKEYEDVLQGKKAEYEVTLDTDGNVESQTQIKEGSKGENLKLTIDSEFQKKVENIVKSNYQTLIDSGQAKYSPGVYVVAMDPKTGGILAMTGYSHEEKSKEIVQNALGTVNSAFVPGSVVKAGTLTAGWQNGAITGNEVLYDEPIKVAGTPTKASIFNPTGNNNRSISAQKALEISSNSYMMKIAFRLLGMEYSQGVAMPYVSDQEQAFNELRSAFAEYGMGVETGIDLPVESTGISTPVEDIPVDGGGGKILDLAFGQFDTYTPLQLAQYVSTIANDGKRMSAHLVEGIYDNDDEGNLGEEIETIEPEVLNTVDISDANLKIIQDGFYDVVHGSDPWTTGKSLADAKMDISAKTGTAETVIYDDGKEVDVVNSNLVAYGPSDDADIAISIMLPQLTNDDDHVNRKIAEEIMNAYYDMYLK